jgi:hypothetical protein
MRQRTIVLVIGLVLGSTFAVWTQDGVNPIGNLRGKVDENFALLVNPGTVDTNIINVPSVSVANNVPSSSSTYAVTPCGIVTTASTNATQCTDAASNLYGILYAINPTSTPAFLRFINDDTGAACTDAVLIPPIPIPAQSAAGVYGGVHLPFINPINFSAGITACVTGAADGTTNAPVAIMILIGVKE